jgi:hypothetical protein
MYRNGQLFFKPKRGEMHSAVHDSAFAMHASSLTVFFVFCILCVLAPLSSPLLFSSAAAAAVPSRVFYGATFFTVEQRQFKDYPSPLTLGITSEGVLLMHPEKRTVLENYAFTDIVTWGHSDEKFIVVVGNIVQQRKLIFKTADGKPINHLIHDYVNGATDSREKRKHTMQPCPPVHSSKDGNATQRCSLPFFCFFVFPFFPSVSFFPLFAPLSLSVR